jgi:hypothetical protein
MSDPAKPAVSSTVGKLVGRCVGVRPGRSHGRLLWATVLEVMTYRSIPGCILRVSHPLWTRPKWEDGRDVRTRNKRDAAILAAAYTKGQAER